MRILDLIEHDHQRLCGDLEPAFKKLFKREGRRCTAPQHHALMWHLAGQFVERDGARALHLDSMLRGLCTHAFEFRVARVASDPHFEYLRRRVR